MAVYFFFPVRGTINFVPLGSAGVISMTVMLLDSYASAIHLLSKMHGALEGRWYLAGSLSKACFCVRRRVVQIVLVEKVSVVPSR